MKILDRYVVRNFLISFLIIAFVLIGLYVLVDLTLNSSQFTEQKEQTIADVVGDIANYYGHQVFVYFRELAGIITLVSAVVTLTTMNRRNEMTAILASGVSLYRVIWPVIILGLACNGLTLADQELVIPRMADQLVRKHDEQAVMKRFPVWFYQMYGAWSQDDYCRVKSVAGPTGGPLAAGAKEAVLHMVPDLVEVEHASAMIKAVEQMRGPHGEFKGDILAVHVGQSERVRLYVRVLEIGAGNRPGTAVDSVRVTLADVAQTGWPDLPSAEAPNLERIQPGDRVAQAEPCYYQWVALDFNPDTDNFLMNGVMVVKRHPVTAEPLARINAKSAAWNAGQRVWEVSPDASVVYLAPARPGQEHLPARPDTGRVAPIHSPISPQDIVLRHSGTRWMQFMSTADLKSLSNSRGSGAPEHIRAVMHVRFTQPVINMILLLLGVPFVLTRAPVGLWQGILRCVLLSGGCFILSFVFQQISGDARSWAVVAAWLPVILFGPLAVLMLDSVKT